MDIDKEIVRFICVMAMRDAVLEKAYSGEKKWLEEKDMMNELVSILAPFFNEIISGKYQNQTEYDEAFLKVSMSICARINAKSSDSAHFSFGNAQKLINICVKYLYVMSYGNDDIKKHFTFCHCPMDKILLEDVWKKRKGLSFKSELRSRDYFLSSWGKEDFKKSENGDIGFPDRYSSFQKAIRILAEKDHVSPLEYDYVHWGNKG